ncbi:MAG TPA: hypothetical protein VFJ48_10520 [Casimicrobiaceae bacterium]|nr:hypothetical protein [Casimicrobiaceae bacterium]
MPLLLVSEVAWWYVTERVVELIALAVISGLAASALVRVAKASRL